MRTAAGDPGPVAVITAEQGLSPAKSRGQIAAKIPVVADGLVVADIGVLTKPPVNSRRRRPTSRGDHWRTGSVPSEKPRSGCNWEDDLLQEPLRLRPASLYSMKMIAHPQVVCLSQCFIQMGTRSAQLLNGPPPLLLRTR